MGMSLESLMNGMPFARLLDMDVERAADGAATVRLPLSEKHSSIPGRTVAHGGAVHALADTAGGAAVISVHEQPTPTVDIRFDHLAPARSDLVADAEILEDGSSVAVVEVTVEDADGATVALARGTYKTGGDADASPWAADPETAPDEAAPE